MKRDTWRRLMWVVVFGVTMGFFEAAVVVYLRALNFPKGFQFPLRPANEMNPLILAVEIIREAMSIGMLLAVGMLAGRRGLERFVLFLCAFGVWDILFYIFLYLTLGWPSSLATFDVLFLIPIPWIAPVWAPAAIAVLFVVSTVIFLVLEDGGRPVQPTRGEWAVAWTGCFIVIASFCLDGPHCMKGGMPRPFQWWWWAMGLAMGLGAFARAVARAGRMRDEKPKMKAGLCR